MLYYFDRKNLTYKRFKWVYHIAISVVATIVLLVATKPDPVVRKRLIEAEMSVNLRGVDEFSPDKLLAFLKELNVRHADIVYAQAVLESYHFKSRIFRENNNFFGMKQAKSRPTTSKGTQHGHAYFDSWRDCAIDYALYSSKYLSRLSRAEYLEYLGQNYAEDRGYVSKLNQIISKL
jgi:hypothetical protein